MIGLEVGQNVKVSRDIHDWLWGKTGSENSKKYKL
jgi:hypothetical protein